jgi:hypothetical protein
LQPLNQEVKTVNVVDSEVKVNQFRVWKRKMVKLVQKLKQLYNKYLKCPNRCQFDEEFYKLLQILYLLGFYQPNPSKTGVVLKIVMFAFMIITYLAGAIKDAVTGNLNQALINVIAFCFVGAVAIQIISFACNQKKFIGIIKELHLLHKRADDESIEKLSKKCNSTVKVYKCFVTVIIVAIIVLHLVGLRVFRLFMPSIYDLLAFGSFYSILLTVNSIHAELLSITFVVTDLMPIICMLRIEQNMKFLLNDLRTCTSTKEINRCAEYHAEIIK